MFLCVSLFGTISCKKEVPALKTLSVTNITAISATSGGWITEMSPKKPSIFKGVSALDNEASRVVRNSPHDNSTLILNNSNRFTFTIKPAFVRQLP